MSKKEIKICMVCRKEIDTSKDKYVLLGTYEGKKILDESYFHMQCFSEWHNSKVMEKSKNTIASAQKKAMGLLGGVLGKGNQTFDIGLDIEKETNIDKAW